MRMIVVPDMIGKDSFGFDTQSKHQVNIDIMFRAELESI